MSLIDHTPPRSYSLDERLDVLRALAADPDVRTIYTDREFLPCAAPRQAEALGLRAHERDPTSLTERLAEVVAPRDHPKLLVALNRARSCGIGVDEILVDSGAVAGDDRHETAMILHVVDMRVEWDVIVWAAGGTHRHADGRSPDDRASLPPRRMVQRRDRHAVILWVDEANEQVLGYRPEQMIGQSSLKFIFGPDHTRAIEGWIALLADQPLERTRIRYVTASDDYRWLEITAHNRLETDGYVEVEMIDVHDEMMALRQARAGEAQFEALTDSLPVGVVQVDADGRIVYANRWMRQVVHIDGDSNMTNLAQIHVDDRATVRAAWEHVVTTHEPRDIDMRMLNLRTGQVHRCHTRVRSLGVDEYGEPRGIIASVQDMTETIDLQEQLARQAQTDFLTGLANRAALTEWLDQQMTPRGRDAPMGTTVLFLDLDRFKRVNDALGHEAGDRLLQIVAARLDDVVRPTDLLARIGGDEFVIACGGRLDADVCAALAERVLATFDEPIVIDDTTVDVGCSLGIARSAVGTDGADADTVLGNADIAMYEAKRSGGRRWSLYEDGLRDRLQIQFHTEAEIRRGLTDGEFAVHVQPIIELTTGLTVAAEALARWEHPARGTLEPSEFIPAAERSGLIRPLGRQIVEHACAAAVQAGVRFARPCRINLNISGRQLVQDDFHDALIETAERSGVDPRVLVLEIAETALLETSEEVRADLADLARRGFTIALDDFGTGLSSLDHLRRYPAAMVKIDRTFTAGLGLDAGTTAILRAMVGLAADLGQELVVEGIERAEQLDALRRLGVRFGQGHLLGAPMPVEEFFSFDRTTAPPAAIVTAIAAP